MSGLISYDEKTTEEYQELRFKLIKQFEGYSEILYLDSAGLLTIGVGFNVQSESVRFSVFSDFFDLNLNNLTNGYTESEKDFVTKINNVLNKTYSSGGLVDVQTQQEKDIAKQLSDILADWKKAADEDVDGNYVINPPSSFTVGEKDEKSAEDRIKDFFDNKFIAIYEAKVDKFISDIPESSERVALLSLGYNQKDGPKALLGNGLKTAILGENRAEAWYQIRYRSNSDEVQAKRRYAESQVFGLFSDVHNVSEKEAKDAVDMYLKYYNDKIKPYEAKYQPKIKEANAELDERGAKIKNVDDEYLTVDSIGQIFKPIANYIYERFVAEADRPAFEANVGNIDFTIQITGDVVLGHETKTGDDTVEFIQPVYRSLYNASPKEGQALPEGITGINDMLVVSDNAKGFSLQGLYGHDVLIGGDQADNLYGGYKRAGGGVDSGEDVLIGGGGDDNLYGQDGNDILRGGDGVDNYYFERGDGVDTIIDQDGKGKIYVKNTASQTDFNVLGSASGGVLTHASPGPFVGSYWEMDAEGHFLTDNRYVPYYDEATNSYMLKVIIDEVMLGDTTEPTNVIWIKNWNNGDFGLTITNLPPLENLPSPHVERLPEAPLIALPPRTGRIFDPLAFDLNNSGTIETLPLLNGVHFDLDNSGFAEQTSWVAPDDGLLVLDRNRNNFIDGGAELFGTETYLNNGNKATNGFEALAEFDSNHDGVINNSDTVFTELQIWKDANTNGLADIGELLTLDAAGIQSISLTNTSTPFVDKNRIEHREQGSFARTDNSTGVIHTLWFSRDARQSVAVHDLQGAPIIIPSTILALPNAQGSGNTYSLHEAMVLDTSGALKAAVEDFVQETDAAARKELVNTILVLWTHQQNTAVNSRGSAVNAQHIGVLESFWGEVASQQQPSGQYAVRVEQIYQQLTLSIYSQLMQQTHAKTLLDAVDFTYDLGKWHGDFSQVSSALIANFVNGIPTALAQLQDFLDVMQGYNPYDINTLYKDFSAAIALAATGLPEATRTLVLAAVFTGNDELIGTTISDVLHGYQGNDDIRGLEGNDQLWGDEGHDQLDAGAGDDSLDGGSGYDALSGGAGNDTYYFARGYHDDVINETSGIDVIELKDGIAESQVRVIRSQSDLQLILDTGEVLTVVGMFNEGEVINDYAIETIRFANNVEWDLARIKKEVLIGSSDNDELEGFDDNDILIGHVGNDVLIGRAGDDTYHYQSGDGADVIVDIAGIDKLVLGAGVTPDQVSLKRIGESLVISFGASGAITVRDMFTVPDGTLIATNAIEAIEFANGVVWNIADIQQAVLLITGTNGNDSLVGSFNNDTLVGAHGNDVLNGSRGDDTYRYEKGDGNDLINDESGIDTLLLGQGIKTQDVNIDHVGNNLVFTFASGGSVTVTNAFADSTNSFLVSTLESISFNDGSVWNLTKIFNETLKIKGSWSDDTLQGTSGNNIFIGRGGNDLIVGGMGDDWYEYNLGDGDDVIDDEGGVDVVSLGQGITADMVDVLRSGANLIISIANSGVITVNNAFLGGGNTLSSSSIEFIRFSDNSAWGVARIQSELQSTGVLIGDTLQGTSGADILLGSSANNLLIGSLGNDVLNGAGGHDTYLFNVGDGADVINETEGFDVIKLGEGIAKEDLNIRREGANLVIKINSSDKITVNNMFVAETGALNVGNSIERIDFSNGEELTLAQIKQAAITADSSSSILYGYESDDVITGGDSWDELNGVAGNDTLIGEEGNDLLRGGLGDDTYIFRPYDGRDEIVEFGGKNIIQFSEYIETDENGEITYRENVTEEGVIIARGDMYVQLKIVTDNGNTIIVEDMFDWNTGALKSEHVIRFANGVEWDSERIQQELLKSTDGNDFIMGFDRANYLSGGNGSDALSGFEFNDTLKGGEGSDHLYGGGGGDTYLYDLGDGPDYISESGGDDVLQLGDGITIENIQIAKEIKISAPGFSDVILLLPNGDRIRFIGMLNSLNMTLNESATVELIKFHNGDILTSAQVLEFIKNPPPIKLIGDDNDNSLTGDLLNEILIGNKGNDTLSGGGGDDDYFFNVGDGRDVVIDGSGLNGVVLGSSYSPSKIKLERLGNDLVVSSLISDDSVKIINYFFFPSLPTINCIKFFDGLVWQSEDIKNNITINPTAGDDALYGTDKSETIFGLEGNDRIVSYNGDDVIFGGDGADTIEAGSGNSILVGGRGDDSLTAWAGIYKFSLGDGIDIIKSANQFGIEFDSTINSDSVELLQAGKSLLIKYSDKDIIKIEGVFGGYRFLESNITIKFEGGVVWGDDYIKSHVSYNADNNDNEIYGIAAFNDFINGMGGDDIIYGGFGKDTLEGGNGNDVVYGADRVGGKSMFYGADQGDFIDGGAGDDKLYGEEGNDVLVGGLGKDKLYGGAGSDTYLSASGDGNDYLTDNSASSSDIYKLVEHHGRDTVDDFGGVDVIELSDAFSESNLDIRNTYSGLLVKTDIGSSVIDIQNSIETIKFSNGVEWNRTRMIAEALRPGDSQNNEIGGFDTDDTLSGGEGMIVCMEEEVVIIIFFLLVTVMI